MNWDAFYDEKTKADKKRMDDIAKQFKAINKHMEELEKLVTIKNDPIARKLKMRLFNAWVPITNLEGDIDRGRW